MPSVPAVHRILVSPSARARRGAALAFLREFPPASEVTCICASFEAADDLVRDRAAKATFGLRRGTLLSFAHWLAAPALAQSGQARLTPLGAEALAARAAHVAHAQGQLASFADLVRFPGFPAALASTLAELRQCGVTAKDLASLAPPAPDVARLLDHYESGLDALADGATIFRAATDVVNAGLPVAPSPLLLYEVAIPTPTVAAFVAALAERAPSMLAILPSGDDATRAALARMGLPLSEIPPDEEEPADLDRLRRHLFVPDAATGSDDKDKRSDDSVQLFSAPGEAREAIEIARRIQAEASAGTPFDRIACLLRSPEAYGSHIETAFRRAGIPSYFSRGSEWPDPAGRAFLALLRTAVEDVSAARFAEYLSLGQVPALGDPSADPFEPPRDEAAPAPVAAREADPSAAEPAPMPTPRRWERHLEEARVSGSRERWHRRLAGLKAAIAARLAETEAEDPGGPIALHLAREAGSVDTLAAFALPLVDRLSDLAGKERTWAQWLPLLSALAGTGLKAPRRVLSLLSELAPLSSVGPLSLEEVERVLAERLTTLPDEPPARRYGRVLVAPVSAARGLSFDVVFVPGLCEHIFPQQRRGDPLLPDRLRAELSPHLATQAREGAEERLLLRLAVGAASRRLYLSYPRLHLALHRARVPSFYLLDLWRALTGRIGDVKAFEQELARATDARLAWPAPEDPAAAIDESEHDLSVLRPLLQHGRPEELRGRARYFLDLNPHLARSLRSRAMRWQRSWSRFDGLVDPSVAARALLARERLDARTYSATALERYAACPYQFYLSAILRLAPREEPLRIERLDPLTRGSLFHRVQAECLRAMRDRSLLPLTRARFPEARHVLEACLDREAAAAREELHPAIARVFDDEVEDLKADLLSWLQAEAAREGPWVPTHFELGFGLPADASRDKASVPAPALLLGRYRLRGSVDLVEARGGGVELRVTDHKTGHAPARSRHPRVGGGSALQPALYGLAVQAIMGSPVRETRLYYCTAAGGFAEHLFALDEPTVRDVCTALETIDAAIASGFLPPAPAPRRSGAASTCSRCDYRIVCGPYEEIRTGKATKTQDRLKPLQRLRMMP